MTSRLRVSIAIITFAVLWLALSFVGCGPLPPPGPVPPPVETDITVTVHVPPGAQVRLDGVAPDCTAGADGICRWQWPAAWGASHLWVTAEGYELFDQHVDLHGVDLDVQVNLQPLPPAPVYPRRTGVVHLEGRSFADDGGPWLAHGATLFWGLWGYQHDRGRLERNLAWLAAQGATDYVRVLGTVCGATWEDRAVDARAPGWAEDVAGFTDLVYDRFGLRVQWTIFGGLDCAPDTGTRRAIVDRLLGAVAGREQKVALIELANEAQGTGWTDRLDELRALARHVQASTDILVAVTSGYDPAWHCAAYAGGVGDVSTVHLDRDCGKVEGPWRPVRQPWGYPGEYGCTLPPGISNEPIGPYASVAEDRDPTRLIAQVLVAHVAGLPASVVHAGPGIRGGGAADLARGRPADLWAAQGLQQTLRGLAALRHVLPGDLASWRRTRHGLPDSPWIADSMWTDTGADHGAVRVYSALDGGRAVTAVIGIKRYVVLTSTCAQTVDRIRLTTGQVEETRTLSAGGMFRLEQGDGAWLVVGR